jgi:hypothetical protein
MYTQCRIRLDSVLEKPAECVVEIQQRYNTPRQIPARKQAMKMLLQKIIPTMHVLLLSGLRDRQERRQKLKIIPTMHVLPHSGLKGQSAA